MHASLDLACALQCACSLGADGDTEDEEEHPQSVSRLTGDVTSSRVMLVGALAPSAKRHLTLSPSGSCARRRTLVKQFRGILPGNMRSFFKLLHIFRACLDFSERLVLYRREDTVVVTGQRLMAWESDRVPRSSLAWVVQLVFPSSLAVQQQPETLKHTRTSI